MNNSSLQYALGLAIYQIRHKNNSPNLIIQHKLEEYTMIIINKMC